MLNNCIVQRNTGLNWDGSDALWTNCCARPVAGVGGFGSAPQFSGGGDYHLQPGSPCIETAIFVPGIVDDFDSVSDHDELVADTDGTDANGFFRISIRPDYQIGYNSSAARQYTLQYNTNLVSGLWHNVAGQTGIPGSGSYYYLTAPSNYPACFFRVGVAFP